MIFMSALLYITVGASFSHQIQSEYYGNNHYVSIEGIALNKFSALEHPSPFWESDNVLTHALFHSLFVCCQQKG